MLVYMSPGVGHLIDGWPGRLDFHFSINEASWVGSDADPTIGSDMKQDRLRVRQVYVSVNGRGLPPEGRRDILLLPGPEGAPVRP